MATDSITNTGSKPQNHQNQQHPKKNNTIFNSNPVNKNQSRTAIVSTKSSQITQGQQQTLASSSSKKRINYKPSLILTHKKT